MTSSAPPSKIVATIGILARNEAPRLPRLLESVFAQTFFAELAARGEAVEIVCIANACTDNTAEVASECFGEAAQLHPHAASFVARTISVSTPGKITAWNLLVHTHASPDSRALIVMDADIRLLHPATLWNLFAALEKDPEANITVGEPVKDIALKPRRTLRESFSLATTRSQTVPGLVTGQLYCIRAETARRIHLPRDLAACEDGFIKELVCTDFLRTRPNPRRIVRVPDASHVFEAYVTSGDVMRNQKRQMIGQTFVHVLLDHHLPPVAQQNGSDLGMLMRDLDDHDPDWLRRLIRRHARNTRFFWQLFPGVLSFRFRRLAQKPLATRILHLPTTIAGMFLTLAGCALAHRALRAGLVQYWPDKSSGNGPGQTSEPAAFSLQRASA
jgi:glycosyltransferase involved in cell wall biosynthesis